MTPNEIFKQWAYNCPHGEYAKKRREIMRELNQNTAQYSNMLRGKTKIHHLAIPIIERITGLKLTDDGNNTLHEEA